MAWRTWTLTKVAVLGVTLGVTVALINLGVAAYLNRPKPWNRSSLTVQWSKASEIRLITFECFKKSLESKGKDDWCEEKVVGFSLKYGVTNNTDEDYELRKERIKIMSDRNGTLTPLDDGYALDQEHYFLPAHQTSLVEVKIDHPCEDGVLKTEEVKGCFQLYLGDVKGLVLFDQGMRYQVDLPKPALAQ